jgi:O-antigen ligase
METLNGLIIWYQRPLDGITGMTGLFNNPNYTGLWLNLIFPFCLAQLIHFRKNKLKSIFNYLFSFLFTFCTVLTNSRAAWISILIGSALVLGKKGLKFILYLLTLIFIVLSATIFPILGNDTLLFLRSIIPRSIWMEFTDFQISRFDIWYSALKTIINNPIFGTGGGSFPEIYKYETGLWKGHAHNLPLELFVSYGIPAGILILLPITYLFLVSTRIIFFKRPIQTSIFDKAWLTSILLLLFSQLVDVQYFDGRISIVFWILLSGAKNIFDQDKDKLPSSL